MKEFFFKCIVCEKEFDKNEVDYICPSCGNNVEVIYDYKKIKHQISPRKLSSDKNLSIWRYLPFLPVENSDELSKIQMFVSPLVKSINIHTMVGLNSLFFKDDTKLPSGSLKDRASAVVVSYGLQNKKKKFVAASTGNAGCALACISAMVGASAKIVVPASIPPAKLTQIMVYGAEIEKVQGTYDDCFDLVQKLCRENKEWFNRSTGINPFTREGKKTVSLEIWEQLGYKSPDIIFVPVGDGNIISGVWKGFKDLHHCGFIEKLPKLIGVQSKNSNAVALTLKKIERKYFSPKNKKFLKSIKEIFQETKIVPVNATTIADSISVNFPRDGYSALKAIIESKGFIVEVEDKEIIDAIKILASKEGIFAEPAGATATAGLLKVSKYWKEFFNLVIVTLVTGNGLKDIKSVSGS